jgi:hypothetical protein
MVNQKSFWGDSGKAFDDYFESPEQRLQFDASISGSEDNHKSSKYDLDGLSWLNLSGRIISVTFNIPYNLRARKGGCDWVRIFGHSFSLSWHLLYYNR